MGRTRKMAHASLGRALVNTKKNTQGDKSAHQERRNLHEEKTHAMKSVTEESSYDEFIATATLAEKEFTAEKLNVKFVALNVTDTDSTSSAASTVGCLDPSEYMSAEDKKAMVVPRRPKWTTVMTAEELDSAEKEAFLNWRRGMAHMQNKQDITPFERNVEVWRQLWRVLEKSNVVMQIVDARNPLLYRSEDLEAYVNELGKRNIILINKADYLSEEQRKHWATFFQSIDLPHAFYSAATANQKLVSVKDHTSHRQDDVEEEGDSENEDEVKENQDDNPAEPEVDEPQQPSNSAHDILNREQLIEFLKSFKPKPEESGESSSSANEIFSVGLVGYPNVGKSSTINSLMGIKRTSVSATPGKTKHFQTLFLEQDLLLCDCPGLVMPAFGGSKGEMILGGILPIDQLTSYSAATALLVQRIPQEKLEKTYGVSLLPKYNDDDFLSAYASIRGFMTVRGIPDTSRASRIVLKDYVNGKLLYCHAPPTVTQEEFQSTGLSGGNLIIPEEAIDGEPVEPVHRRPPTLRSVNVESRLDNNFFAPPTASAHYKGRQYVASGLTAGTTNSGSIEKPWRKHNNRNKKEKLRRVYRHLDVE